VGVRLDGGRAGMTDRPVRREDGRCLMCNRRAHEIDAFCSAVCCRAWWGTPITGDPVNVNESRERVARGGTQIERHK
jgi:hypothetical protein